MHAEDGASGALQGKHYYLIRSGGPADLAPGWTLLKSSPGVCTFQNEGPKIREYGSPAVTPCQGWVSALEEQRELLARGERHEFQGFAKNAHPWLNSSRSGAENQSFASAAAAQPLKMLYGHRTALSVYSFIFFSFQFSLFCWTMLGLFLLFPLALIFTSPVTHICFSVLENDLCPPAWRQKSFFGRKG